MRFYYDVVCPFAYLASTRIAGLAEQAGVQLEWRPVLLGGLLKAHGAPTVPMDAMPAAKARLTVLDALRQADLAGVPLRFPEAHPRRTVDAMRLLVAVDAHRRPELTAALYRAYWVDGLDVADREVLTRLAAPFGLDPARVCADPAVREQLFANTAEAVERGVFGVPTVEVDGELHWGSDRLSFVRDRLGLPPEEEPAGEGGGRVTFFHDFSSPFSYLAAARIEQVAARAGARVEWVPFLLGALFREIGTPMVPLASFSEARRRWQVADLERHAARHGIPFRFNSTFPLRTVTALRVALVEPGVTPALYAAAWARDLDVGDEDVLRSVLDEAGFEGAELLERAGTSEVKDGLRANTERALRAGACGAPTFVVGDQLFWGQDRLDMVAAALRGWRSPTGVAAGEAS